MGADIFAFAIAQVEYIVTASFLKTEDEDLPPRGTRCIATPLRELMNHESVFSFPTLESSPDFREVVVAFDRDANTLGLWTTPVSSYDEGSKKAVPLPPGERRPNQRFEDLDTGERVDLPDVEAIADGSKPEEWLFDSVEAWAERTEIRPLGHGRWVAVRLAPLSEDRSALTRLECLRYVPRHLTRSTLIGYIVDVDQCIGIEPLEDRARRTGHRFATVGSAAGGVDDFLKALIPPRRPLAWTDVKRRLEDVDAGEREEDDGTAVSPEIRLLRRALLRHILYGEWLAIRMIHPVQCHHSRCIATERTASLTCCAGCGCVKYCCERHRTRSLKNEGHGEQCQHLAEATSRARIKKFREHHVTGPMRDTMEATIEAFERHVL